MEQNSNFIGVLLEKNIYYMKHDIKKIYKIMSLSFQPINRV